MPIDNQLLKALGLGGATIGGGAAIHGAGLGSVLEPLDYPRRALMNLVRSPMRTLETGDPMHLLGALPGAAGVALGGLVGGPLGVLAGSALGGSLQGAGELTGMPEFQAPQVSDITGTEDFLPNFLVGTLTDPLTYAGLGASFGAGKKALTPLGGALKEAAPVAKAAETAAIPVAKLAPPLEEVAQQAAPMAKSVDPSIPVAKPIAPTFYSRLEEGINQFPDSIKSESVINKLKKAGVTDEEIEATGITRALEGKPRVTRDELLQHFGENKVQVEEVFRGGMSDDLERWQNLFDIGERRSTREQQEFMYLNQKLEGQPTNVKPGKYSDYQTPGGENYRELLLTVPERTDVSHMQVKEMPRRGLTMQEEQRFKDLSGTSEDNLSFLLDREREELAALTKKMSSGQEQASIQQIDNPSGPGGKSFQIFDYNNKPMFNDAVFPTKEQARDYMMSKHQGMNFGGSHWDEPNVLAHARFNDRVGPNGEKILHIEEIQSDWHQAGREAGYGGIEEDKAQILRKQKMEDARDNYSEFRSKHFKDESGRNTRGDKVMTAADREEYKRLELDLKEAQKEFEGRVIGRGLPDAPFKENWHELAMKRLIRYASENGYDAITINPGEQINKVLSSGSEALGGQRKFYGSPGTGPVPEGFHIEGSPENKAAARALREELVARGVQQGSREWHTAFADLGDKAVKYVPQEKGTLPNWLNKYAKQFGVKVEPFDIPAGIENEFTTRLNPEGYSPGYLENKKFIKGSGIRISPQMRKQVMTRGQPLMQIGLPIAGGGSALLAALMGENQA